MSTGMSREIRDRGPRRRIQNAVPGDERVDLREVAVAFEDEELPG